nr:MAG TPA: hypothetical protein [Caudoviricetes sp.]
MSFYSSRHVFAARVFFYAHKHLALGDYIQ